MKHRPDIDGLRAFAVLPVVFYHVGWGFPGGFVGVDIFFVISGFLISGILLQELEKDRFSLLGFYDRRVRRILPALSFMLVGVLAAAWWIFLPYEFEQLGKHLTHTAAFLSNYWLETKAGDYWAPGAEAHPLLHTWSLAVEEQFYIFMPILLWVLYRYCRKQLGLILGVLFLVSLYYGIRTTSSNPAAAFYLLPSRAWELLLGALIYLASLRTESLQRPLLREGMSLVGLLMVIGSCFLITGEMAFPGWVALIPTTGAALLILANAGSLTRCGQFLSWRPFQWVGLISYSLYLWHWPAIVFVKAWRYPGEPTLVDETLIVLGSVAMATISWHWVEQPFRGKRFKNMPRRVVTAGAVVLIFWGGISLLIRQTDGYPPRFETRVPEQVFNMIQSDVLDDSGSGDFQAKSRFAAGGIQHNIDANNPPRWVVIGDSHGAMFAPVLSEITSEQNIPVAFFTQDGVTPLFGSDEASNQLIRDFVVDWQPEAILVILRWDHFWSGIDSEENSRNENTQTTKADMFRWLASRCERLYVTLQIPKISNENTRAAKIFYNRSLRNGGQLPELLEDHREAAYRKQTRDFLEDLQLVSLTIIDPSSAFLNSSSIRYHDNGRLFYRDEDHLNLRGARETKAAFLNHFTLGIFDERSYE